MGQSRNMRVGRGEGLRLLHGMLTVEAGTGREGGTSFPSAQAFNIQMSSFLGAHH